MVTNLIPSAEETRNISKNDIVIFNEVTDITRAILEARNMGFLEVKVFDTFMTDVEETDESSLYYQVWQEQLDDRVRDRQMTEVLNCFKDKGYSIVRKTNPLTLNTFMWEIKW